MAIVTICQSCGARVRIKTRVIGTGRAADCPRCRLPLTGPAIVPKPAKKHPGQVPEAPPQPEPAPLVPVGNCASCGAPLSVPPEALGRWSECGKCGAGFAAVADTAPTLSPQAGGSSPGPARDRGGINLAGLSLALGVLCLLAVTLVMGGVMLGGNRPWRPPASGAAASPQPESRREQLLRRLGELRVRIKALEARRDELGQTQGAGDEDRDLDARLALNKELAQVREEEEQVLAELEALPRETEENGR